PDPCSHALRGNVPGVNQRHDSMKTKHLKPMLHDCRCRLRSIAMPPVRPGEGPAQLRFGYSVILFDRHSATTNEFSAFAQDNRPLGEATRTVGGHPFP